MAKLTKENIIKAIEEMTVLELNELVKDLEDKFGVSAAAMAPVAAAAPVVEEAEEAEQTEFDVILANPGEKKIHVIKAVRAITGLDLKAAKELVEAAPKAVKEKLKKDEAEDIKAKLEEVGAIVEIK